MRLYSLLVLTGLAAVSLSAQTFRGEIKGSVEDPSGAVLSDTKITAVNSAHRDFPQATLSGSSGEFSIPRPAAGILFGNGGQARLPGAEEPDRSRRLARGEPGIPPAPGLAIVDVAVTAAVETSNT